MQNLGSVLLCLCYGTLRFLDYVLFFSAAPWYILRTWAELIIKIMHSNQWGGYQLLERFTTNSVTPAKMRCLEFTWTGLEFGYMYIQNIPELHLCIRSPLKLTGKTSIWSMCLSDSEQLTMLICLEPLSKCIMQWQNMFPCKESHGWCTLGSSYPKKCCWPLLFQQHANTMLFRGCQSQNI